MNMRHVIKILKNSGFGPHRNGKGSHNTWANDTGRKVTLVYRSLKEEQHIQVIKMIEQQSGVKLR